MTRRRRTGQGWLRCRSVAPVLYRTIIITTTHCVERKELTAVHQSFGEQAGHHGRPTQPTRFVLALEWGFCWARTISNTLRMIFPKISSLRISVIVSHRFASSRGFALSLSLITKKHPFSQQSKAKQSQAKPSRANKPSQAKPSQAE